MEGSYLRPLYDSVGGTALQRGQRADVPSTGSRELSAWLESDEALNYEGLWVLLDNWRPQDHDLSPSALKERHPDSPVEMIVFVQPSEAEIDP